uniref:Uncharacterized protein n=1 Tax=Rhizophora mucronata TaxID=61149 RepID=A0A2P2NLV7_RHIMU
MRSLEGIHLCILLRGLLYSKITLHMSGLSRISQYAHTHTYTYVAAYLFNSDIARTSHESFAWLQAKRGR